MMADSDPSISDGTCYAAREKRASLNFIPCGNSAFGDIHCCQAGDNCLENNACYNGRHGTTYLAGCTDFDYEDPSCPDKKSYQEYPWAGLIYCRPNRWVACEEAAKPTTITVGDKCTCPPDSESMTVAFTAAGSIPGIASLPTTSGGTIEWFVGHVPTTTPRPTASSSSSSETTDSSSTITSSSNMALPTSTSAADDSSSSPQTGGLSDGQKAGIGVGAAAGAILLLGAISALWVVLRRRRNDKNNTTASPEAGQNVVPTQSGKTSGPDNGPGAVPARMPTPEVPPRPPVSELPAGPWVMRPELQMDATPAAAYSQASSEAEAVSPPGAPASLVSSSLVSSMSPGWQGWNQGWGGAMAALLPVAEGAELDYQQDVHSQQQHQDGPAPIAERHKFSRDIAVELPA